MVSGFRMCFHHSSENILHLEPYMASLEPSEQVGLEQKCFIVTRTPLFTRCSMEGRFGFSTRFTVDYRFGRPGLTDIADLKNCAG